MKPTVFAAATIARAMRSHCMMPPKMFTSTPFTLASERMMRNASVTACSLAPPPTSRKLAGSPPCSLMMSIVDIARPAPFTRQPMFPSRATKFSSNSRAFISEAFSSVGSNIARRSGWRNSALSSKLNFASIAITWPSGCAAVAGVTTSGLISARLASFAR